MNLFTYLRLYLSQLFFFLGIGLISGSIVHITRDPIIYGILGICGLGLFVTGSIMQQQYKKEQLGRQMIFATVIFAAGIGIASGGIQHFADVGRLSPIYIAVGLSISFYIFAQKERIDLDKKTGKKTFIFSAVGGLLLFVITSGILFGIRTLGHGGGHGDNGHDGAMQDHGAMIGSSYDFVRLMIPHHKEAIESASILLDRTQNQELQVLLRGIIAGQSNETDLMTQMIEQYRPAGSDHKSDDTEYHNMMDIDTIRNGTIQEAEESFLSTMIDHHKGAIAMAYALLELNDTTQDVRMLAYDVIAQQSQEIITMYQILINE